MNNLQDYSQSPGTTYANLGWPSWKQQTCHCTTLNYAVFACSVIELDFATWSTPTEQVETFCNRSSATPDLGRWVLRYPRHFSRLRVRSSQSKNGPRLLFQQNEQPTVSNFAIVNRHHRR